jgi:phosphatidylserine/phosphatidylglycerophosphate/cardiolipin synthase-like enzyme
MIHGETLYTFSRDEVLKCLRDENTKLDGLMEELNRIEEKVVNSQEKAIIQLSEEMWTGLPEQAELQTARFVQEAKQSILISTYMFEWFNRIEGTLLSRAKSKEVVVRVLMTDPSSPRMFSSEHRRDVQSKTLRLREAGVEVNFTTERMPFRGSIFDEKAALIMMFPYSNEKEANICTGFCVCTNSAIVHTLIDFFNTCIQQPNRNIKD